MNFIQPPLYEFLGVIEPDNYTSRLILTIKNNVTYRFGCGYAAGLKPHITVSNFLQSAYMEKKIFESFERTTAAMAPYKVHVNGFGHFETHTVFAKVTQESTAVMAEHMKKKSSAIIQTQIRQKPYFIKEPHLTIARGMTPEQFSLTWAMLKGSPLVSSFMAYEMTLLRRDVRGGKYEVIKKFPFTGNYTVGNQLTLSFATL